MFHFITYTIFIINYYDGEFF